MPGGGQVGDHCPRIDGFSFIIDANGVCVGSPVWSEVFTQAGRLDFVTLVLAAIGLGLAFLAFPAYKVVRVEADKTARQAVEDLRSEVRQITERVAIEAVQERLPRIVESYVEVRGLTDEDADRIAMAQEDGQDG